MAVRFILITTQQIIIANTVKTASIIPAGITISIQGWKGLDVLSGIVTLGDGVGSGQKK